MSNTQGKSRITPQHKSHCDSLLTFQERVWCVCIERVNTPANRVCLYRACVCVSCVCVSIESTYERMVCVYMVCVCVSWACVSREHSVCVHGGCVYIVHERVNITAYRVCVYRVCVCVCGRCVYLVSSRQEALRHTCHISKEQSETHSNYIL